MRWPLMTRVKHERLMKEEMSEYAANLRALAESQGDQLMAVVRFCRSLSKLDGGRHREEHPTQREASGEQGADRDAPTTARSIRRSSGS